MPATDRITIDPRERFRRSLTDPAAYRAKVSDPQIMGAVDATLAHMAASPGATREMLNGARYFAETFLNISEPAQPQPQLPIQTLKSQ